METKQFSFTDEEFLRIINVVIKKETTGNVEFKPVTSMDESIEAGNLDSLGVMVFFVWLSEMFGIPDDEITQFTDKNEFTVAAIRQLIIDKQTQTYTYQAALEFEAQCL